VTKEKYDLKTFQSIIFEKTLAKEPHILKTVPKER